VRLFARGRLRVNTPKKPHQKFLCHVRRLMLMRPGCVTCRHWSRDRPSHANTLARWFARDGDVVSLQRAAMVAVVPPSHAHVLAFEPRFGPKRGQRPSGLDMVWHGAQSRAEPGVELATRAWLDVTHHRAATRRVEQTALAPHRHAEETRLDASRAQMARVVTTPPVPALKSLAVDGAVSQPTFGAGLCAVAWPVSGQRRRDAKRRHLDSGPRGDGPGRPKPDDGTVAGSDRSRFEPVEAGDADRARAAPVVKPPPCTRHLHVVVGRPRPTGRSARRFRTDVSRSATTLSRSDQACFQIDCLCRDAPQCTGLRDGQARSAGTRRVHVQASRSAVRVATLEARQRADRPQAPFAMASLTRRYVNQPLVDRM
jgi:hypothetical protein